MAGAKDRWDVACDDKGRIQLTKEDRDRYGDRFIVVRTGRGLWFYPVHGDPVEEMAKLGRSLPDMSLVEFKKAIYEQALREAGVKGASPRRRTR